jgi:carbamoyl-phosphate synthase large subunit
MNVLLTCAGRRNYLVKYFQDALGDRGHVVAVDASPQAPALQKADRSFIVPLISQPDYLNTLLAICREYRIALLFSLNDLELPLIARNRKRFLQVGTLPVISAVNVVDTCFDKWATLKFLRETGLKAVQTFFSLEDAQEALSQGGLAFPLVVKPRWGSASIEITYPEDEEELRLSYRLIRKRLPRTMLVGPSATDVEHSVIIQQKLTGQEYGLDVINDLKGNYVTTFVKRKIKMRAGETDKAMTVEKTELLKLGETIGRNLAHVGNLDCDVFLNGKEFYVLEMNPRFGGGYPFSHIAGANLPAALIAWARHEPVDPDWLQVKLNVAAAKYDNLIVVDYELKD